MACSAWNNVCFAAPDEPRSLDRGAQRFESQGKVYGYRPGRKAGQLHIVAEEAEVIRNVFEWHSEGVTPLQIATLLNDAGVPAPRGGKWSFDHHKGPRPRRNRILRNPKYNGVLVFGRTAKRSRTGGKKRGFPRSPQGQMALRREEGLRIVDRRTWVAVQLRLAKHHEASMKAKSAASDGMARSPVLRVARSTRSTDLFHGLYRCTCGSRMTAVLKGLSGRRQLLCQAAFQPRDLQEEPRPVRQFSGGRHPSCVA